MPENLRIDLLPKHIKRDKVEHLKAIVKDQHKKRAI